MKRLSEYVLNNYISIYENFSSNHILSEDEINNSDDNVFNEGFWDFLSQIFKSLFGNASDDTKHYGENIFGHGKEKFGNSYQNEVGKLLKENNIKKFISLVERVRKSWVTKKTMDEKKSYAEACFILELKKKILIDEGEEKDIKLIEKRIEEYKKKAGEALQQTKEEIQNVNKQNKKEKTGHGAPSQELSDAADKAFEEYKSEIDQLCKAGNTTPEQLKNVVFQLVKSDKVLNTINESKTVFGLCIMAIGAKLAESFEGDYNVIAMFMGTVGALAEKKKLN
jgi:hypothetical protein